MDKKERERKRGEQTFKQGEGYLCEVTYPLNVGHLRKTYFSNTITVYHTNTFYVCKLSCK